MDWALSHPHHLWWLLLLPLVWWLSRPVRPRRRVATPHLAQWLRARAKLGLRPVRFPWLRFLLAVVVVVAGTLALAEPVVGARRGPTELLVLLDASASMASPNPGSSFARALVEIEARLDQLPEHVAVRVLLAGEVPQLLDGSRDELRARLRQVEPRGVGRVRLPELAAGLLADSAGAAAVWTLGDGLGPSPLPDAGALTVVGQPRGNAAIIALEVEDSWPLASVEVVATVLNAGAQPWSGRVRVAGAAEAAVEVALAPGSQERVGLSLLRGDGGPLTVRLEAGAGVDALPADDEVQLGLPAPPAPDIAVLADQDASPWLRAAAEVLAQETGGRVVDAAAGQPVGLLLVDGGVLPERAPQLRAITFGTRSQTRPLQRQDLVLQPRLLDWDREDPLTRGLDLSELTVAACLARDFLGGGKALLRAEHGPMATVDETADSASVHLAFRLADTNLPLLPAFPQFLRRALVRCYRGGAEVAFGPANLLSAAESTLAAAAPRPQDRPLPSFGAPGRSLVVPLLLLALLAAVARIYA